MISAELSRNQADTAAVLRVVARHLPAPTEWMLVEPMPKTIANGCISTTHCCCYC